MPSEKPPIFSFDMLLDAVGDQSIIFQDLLDAGYGLQEVEQLSDRFLNLGMGPVTISTLLKIKADQNYAEISDRILPYALGRLRREI